MAAVDRCRHRTLEMKKAPEDREPFSPPLRRSMRQRCIPSHLCSGLRFNPRDHRREAEVSTFPEGRRRLSKSAGRKPTAFAQSASMKKMLIRDFGSVNPTDQKSCLSYFRRRQNNRKPAMCCAAHNTTGQRALPLWNPRGRQRCPVRTPGRKPPRPHSG